MSSGRRNATRASENARDGAKNSALLQGRRELFGLAFLADLRRGVHAHEVALAGQPEARGAREEGRGLGRLGLFGHEDLADFFPREKGIGGLARDLFLRGRVDLHEGAVLVLSRDLEDVLAGLLRAFLASEG